ncbi:MAG: RNA methyltransferase [Ferruginibacter sp.]|nr:RNA methyltransferase [Cytophagales bacterium]
MELITSLQNSRVKNVIRLEKASERRQQNLIVVEGLRELTLAAQAGWEIGSLFICREKVRHWAEVAVLERQANQVYGVSVPVFEKMAYRDNTDGLVALTVPRRLALSDVKLSPQPLLIVLEAVEKPGNLGAVLRTADAARVDAVIVCDPQTDLFNPNVIRSSVGCLFTNQVVVATTPEVQQWLRGRGIRSCAAALTARHFYHQTDFTVPTALVLGTEATGLSDAWLSGADQQIKVPMQGRIDSLNVSATTAILVYEARRQRNFE